MVKVLKYIGIALLGAACTLLPEVVSDKLADDRAARYKSQTGYSEDDALAEIVQKEEVNE